MVGPTHPAYTHGKRSKYDFGSRLGEIRSRIEASAVDPFDLEDDATMLNALLVRAIDDLPGSAPTPRSLRSRIQRLVDALAARGRSGEDTAILVAAEELSGALNDALDYQRQAAEWERLIDLKRKMVDSHVRKLAREYAPLTWPEFLEIVEEMRALMARIVDDFVPPGDRPVCLRMLRSLTDQTARSCRN